MDDCGQLDWLDSELQLAASRDQTVLILVHAAAVLDSFNDKDLWTNETQAQRFRDIIESHNKKTPGLVQAIFMGHVHKDEYKIIHGKNISDLVPVIVAPAISPVYDNNPGFRIMYFNEGKISDESKTRKVITLRDYDQYYTDLRESYTNNATNWKREYRFSKAYDKSALRTEDFVNLHKDLSKHSTLLSEYMVRSSVDYYPQERSILCAYNSNNGADFKKCVDNWT